MATKTAAVAGASGFIGQSVVSMLAEAGYHVRALARRRPVDYADHPNVTWSLGDLSDGNVLARGFANQQLVVHLVGGQTPAQSNQNILGDLHAGTGMTIRMLEAAKECGVERFIFGSSGGTVYGNPESIPVDESAATKPMSAYGVSKLASEKYLELYEYLYKIKCFSMRISNPYGKGQYAAKDQGVIAHFINRAIQHETVDIFGDGRIIRDFVYISDVARAFLRVANYQGDQRIFNIGSGRGVSINDIIEIIQSQIGHSVERSYFEARKADVPVNFLDITRAQRELQWKPLIDISLGVSKAITWMKSINEQRNENV